MRRGLDRDGPPIRNETIRNRLNRTLNRNETIRPRDGAHSRTLRERPPNRKTRGNRPTLPTIPLPAANHPEQSIERGDHDSQTSSEENDTRVDDEPFHNEAHGAGASATTMRKPVLGAHPARIVERTRKRNTVAKTHFRFNLSHQTG